MTIYVHYDAVSHNILGYYDEGQYALLGNPAPVRLITEAEYGAAVGACANSIQDGILVHRPLLAAERSLDEMRAQALDIVDRRAGEARASLVSAGDLQVEEYRRAADEAARFLAGEAGSFPALDADVMAGILDPRSGLPVKTRAEAADLILFMQKSWHDRIDEIRTIRLRAKADLRAAGDTEAVAAVLERLSYPT